MSRDLIVGDVHGCLEELEELVALLEPSRTDRWGFLGDLVDRGPDSAGVVRQVRGLLDRHPGSVCIAGNHEEKHLRHRDRGRGTGLPDLSDDDWAFLDALPLYHRLPAHGAVLVHAGFFPRYFEKHEVLGDPSPTWRRDRDRRAERQLRFLRVRHVNPFGEMVSLGQETAADVPWTHRYDGREGHVFYGHEPLLAPPEPLRTPHATGLDTGCCFGGRLTAAILEPGRDVAFVSVPARARYAEPRRFTREAGGR